MIPRRFPLILPLFSLLFLSDFNLVISENFDTNCLVERVLLTNDARPMCASNRGFLRIEKHDASDRPKNFCHRVHDYGCNQTRIVTNRRELQSLIDAHCTELNSDLIIANLHGKSLDMSVFSKIRKIGGRLIISGNRLFSRLTFSQLSEIGGRVLHGQSPTLQITDNRIKSVKFPYLEQVACPSSERAQCVVIGGNRRPGERNMRLMIGDSKLKTSKIWGRLVQVGMKKKQHVRYKMKSRKRYEALEKKKGASISYIFEDLRGEMFSESSKPCLGIGLFCLFLSCVFVASAFLRQKSRDVRLISDEFEYSDEWGLEIQDLSV